MNRNAISHGEAIEPMEKRMYKGCWSMKSPTRGSLCRWQRQQRSCTQPAWLGKDWASSSFYCWDTEHVSDYPVRDSGLSTAHLPPEERVFGCGWAAAPGSLAPVAPDWLQPSSPGSIPSPLLLITKLFPCLPRNISWWCRSLHLCSHPPSPGCVWS